MSLTLVAVPIGNPKDITIHGLEALKGCDLIIGEERKPLFQLFRTLELPRPETFELLNEHSDPDDIHKLAQLCHSQKVALVTDAGTPGFCDPGADLVRQCRQLNIEIRNAPGACSLTAFLSLLGQPLHQFHFEGFLPRKTEERKKRLKLLASMKIPVILMDTPYRLSKTLEELKENCPKSLITLGCDLTSTDELILIGSADKIAKKIGAKKANFLLMISPKK